MPVSGKEITYENLPELIVGNPKASPEQILDDLQGILSLLQKKMLRVVLLHIDELNQHIASLDNEIDRNIQDQYRDFVDAVTDSGPDSAKAILAVIVLTCPDFLLTRILLPGQIFVPAIMRAPVNAALEKRRRETNCRRQPLSFALTLLLRQRTRTFTPSFNVLAPNAARRECMLLWHIPCSSLSTTS